MGCPVHIWLPAMAAMAPFARVTRDRVRSMWNRTPSERRPRTRTVQRFAPVGAARPTMTATDADASD